MTCDSIFIILQLNSFKLTCYIETIKSTAQVISKFVLHGHSQTVTKSTMVFDTLWLCDGKLMQTKRYQSQAQQPSYLTSLQGAASWWILTASSHRHHPPFLKVLWWLLVTIIFVSLFTKLVTLLKQSIKTNISSYHSGEAKTTVEELWQKIHLLST